MKSHLGVPESLPDNALGDFCQTTVAVLQVPDTLTYLTYLGPWHFGIAETPDISDIYKISDIPDICDIPYNSHISDITTYMTYLAS